MKTQAGRYVRPVWFMVGINVTLLVIFLSTHLVECFSADPTDTASSTEELPTYEDVITRLLNPAPSPGAETAGNTDGEWIDIRHNVEPKEVAGGWLCLGSQCKGEYSTWSYPSDCNTCTCSAPVMVRDGKRYRNEGAASCSCTLASCVHDYWVEIGPEVGK